VAPGAHDRHRPLAARAHSVSRRRGAPRTGPRRRPRPHPAVAAGYPTPAPSHENKHIGEVCGLRHNRIGDFEGFDLPTPDVRTMTGVAMKDRCVAQRVFP